MLNCAFLNLDNVSKLRTERLMLFHSLPVARTKQSLVKESLQNGRIISLPFRRGHIVVTWIVRGIRSSK